MNSNSSARDASASVSAMSKNDGSSVAKAPSVNLAKREAVKLYIDQRLLVLKDRYKSQSDVSSRLGELIKM
jgi:hypothetical protein